MKRWCALLLSIILLFAMASSFSSCTLPWEKERARVFEEIDKIEKSSEYAIITTRRYVTATEKIVFEDIIKDKISEDGHKIKSEKAIRFKRFGDLIVFTFEYKSQKRFWGLNDANNYWAVGAISLEDFSIEIHYLKNKYEELHPEASSNTHLCFGGKDNDAKKDTNQNGNEIINLEFVTINRSSGKIKVHTDYQFVESEIGEKTEAYVNPKTFVLGGEIYTINNGVEIWNEDKQIVANINASRKPVTFKYSDILKVSPELQQVNTILGEVSDYKIAAYFFTNGEDLFVGFVTDFSMFGAECNLTCPVIFKTNLNFDSFEYVGCVSGNYTTDFYKIVQIEKIN